MADFLSSATEGAADLQANYSGAVSDAWAAFYNSDCGAADPTCGSAHESLGRCALPALACPGLSASHRLHRQRSHLELRLLADSPAPCCSMLTDGFDAASTAAALAQQPSSAPIIQLQDQLNATYR